MNLSTRVLLGVFAFVCTVYGQSNETVVENANPGTTNWQLTNPALNREIEGYASLTSVNAGSSISFFASTAAPSYTMDVYRLGWYGGTGGRQMLSTISRTGGLQTTPAADSFGRFECTWTNGFVLAIPANWVSGIYLVKLTASTGPQSYIQFVVREDARASAYLFQHSDTTDQAYNNWPGPAANGKSLYSFNSSGSVPAVKVSFNRPYFIDTDSHYFSHNGAGFLLRWEVMMIRWLESKGYDVAYCSNVDTHENGPLLLRHKAFLSVGHDEYWSWEMRANVEAARDQGVGLAFFSANVSYWQIRFETSPISGAADRTIVGYKETAQAGIYGATVTNDPTNNSCLITTNWRYNTCKPSEQAFVGVEFIEGSVGCPSTGTCVDMVIADGSSWAVAGSGLATGSHIPGILGYEVDGLLTTSSPAGTQTIAKSPIPVLNNDAQNHPFSEMVTYTAGSGATVFAVGTFQWSWGLDDFGAPAQRPSQLSAAVQKITQNVLARFAPSVPDLTITTSHTGNFTPGQTGATYTLTVTNTGGGPTTGIVTVTDSLPTGLTATSIGGTGWTCTQPAGSCTRSDALAAAASYPVLTLTVNVAGNAPSVVTNTSTVSGGGETNTSNDTDPDVTGIGATAGPPITDNFNTSSLNTGLWTFVNPVGDGSFSMTGTQLKLNVPAASNHDPTFGGANNSMRVVQPTANTDFTITAKFDSIPNQQYQFEGILVDQDAANYLRFQFGSTASALFATASVILSHNESSLFSSQLSLPGGTTSLWLRVQRSGNTWTESWSPNGTTFTTAGTFTQALTAADIGPFAGNYNPTTSAAPAFAAIVDSFVSGTGAATPDLTITKSHSGSFAQGQTGATYTITVTNAGGAATSGTVTVADTLPTGLTATSIAGTGWTCTQPAGSCTRSDALAAAASYPPLTLTVNVAGNAPSTVTNTATVSGGGETNTANNSASDATSIGSAAGPPVTDNFNLSTLNTGLWTFVNPVADGSFSMTGTQLKLNVPAGSNHDPAFGGADNSTRVVQSIANADFTATTKFDSIPSQQYQFEGILVEQDTANYLRLQFGSTGTALFATASAILAHNETSLFSNQISLPAGTTSLWLRVQKTGNSWTESWSPDGTTFTTVGTFTQALTVADIGPFAANYNPTTSSAPAFSALVDSFVSGTVTAAPDLTITKSHTGNFAQGQTGATYTITVTNSGGASTSGTVTVTDTLPTGLTATGIAGTGWTCTQPAGSCTRSDVLAAAGSYPALTLTVNVAANAPATVTNTATVSGGGETNTANDTASNPTTIGTAATPDLTITKSHTGNFTVGQSGATYTLTVTNSGTAATSGTVTVTDTLPTGLTATSIAGTGWTCTQPAGSCTRTDALAAAASYPALTLTVNVAANAPATVTNTATVSGGGETNTANDTASDATTVGSSVGAPVTDNFNLSSLNTSLWTFVNPVGDGSFSMTGTQLKINVPAGPNHDAAFNGVDSAPRVVQTIANADFTVTTKFDSIPSQQYQFEGMVVDQNAANFLRFQFGSSGTALAISADTVLASNITGAFSNTITLPGGTTSLWLRVQRAGNIWTVTWSPDGATFNTGGTFTQALTVADIGLFGGNYGATTAPAFSALVDSFVSGTVAAVPDLTITKSHTGNFAQGQTGATYTITVTNSGGAATSGTVTVTDTLPTGLTATSIAGTGWTCTQPAGSCTRSDVLAAAGSYPALTLTVNVAANAPATVTNTATVSGGGETNTANDTASNPTTIGTAATPDLTITKSHTGNFTVGQSGATYAITVTNSGTAATSGTVTVTDTLPTGLTATSIAGTGWTCTQPAGSCTRTDALAAAASYPALTLTVNVAANAPATVTNTATVSGGGETNTANDTASDATTVGSSVGAPVTDNFNLSSLDTSLWTFVNPVGDGSFSMTGTQLKINVPAGPNHDAAFNGVDSAPRVVQTIANADFTVTTKFDSIPSQQYQFEGMVVDQNAANFLRFQFGSSGTALAISADTVLASNITGAFSNTITLPGGTTSLWLRVQRAGNIWTVTWSPDGTTFNSGGTFTQALTIADIGLFGGNYGATTAPAFSALVDSFVSGTVAAVPDLTITKSHTGNFAQGQTGATYTITVTNSGGAATSGTVTVTDTLPTGLTATSIAGTGWTCTQPAGSCTRSDVLAAAGSYPALTLTVSVAANAPATVTNTATVSGGGETNTTNDTASNPTTIGTAGPDLTITKSHTGSFTQGQAGATYTITVTNSGTAATSGTVTVTDTLPTGLTATSIAGTGWTCTQPAGSCTRSNALAAAASYPALTLTVTVAANAPATVTNTATVSGGGETNMANDTASDPTTIQAAGSLVSDDFSAGALNTGIWTFVNPQGDGSFNLNGNSLVLTVPPGINHDPWTNGENGIGVMQAAPDTDFEIEVKFSSAVDKQAPFQQQGIIIQQDASNFLRLCMYSDNQRTLVFLASILGTSGNIIVSQETRGGAATWMRVKRTGNNWLYSYSFDSIHWTPFAFTQALHVTKVGPYAGNAQFNGGQAPGFTAKVDHFINRASPLSTIDGSPYPPAAAPPVINVWYGDNQSFGQPGMSQQWVNILGDVSSFDQVTTLTYSLNGGAEQPLWMGENLVRLVAPGDFNVEIDYASLAVGSNSVRITATDTLGRQTTHTVTLTVVKNQTVPLNYSVDWSKVQSPQTVSQVVDGPWQIQSGAVRITETGYDRLIAIGDRTTWKNFVATAEVTMNSLDTFGFAVAIIAGWQGHSTLQYGQPLPDQPRTGHPFPAFGGYAMGLPGPPAVMLYQNTPSVPESIIVQDSSVQLSVGVKYIFKLQAQQNSSGGTHYMFKVWPASGQEPAAWNIQGDGELSTGSIVLAAHRADVSFGLVTVTGL